MQHQKWGGKWKKKLNRKKNLPATFKKSTLRKNKVLETRTQSLLERLQQPGVQLSASWGTIEGTPDTPQTSQHYGIAGFKGVSIGYHYAERRESLEKKKS